MRWYKSYIISRSLSLFIRVLVQDYKRSLLPKYIESENGEPRNPLSCSYTLL
jgi:hypothetical protein